MSTSVRVSLCHRGWSSLKGLTIFSTYPFPPILSFPVRNSCCPWWLHPHLESVLVVKDLGIQLTRCGIFGQKTKQFIDQHRVVDVIINEVITMVCIWEFISSFFNSGKKKPFPNRNKSVIFQLLLIQMKSLVSKETVVPNFRSKILLLNLSWNFFYLGYIVARWTKLNWTTPKIFFFERVLLKELVFIIILHCTYLV